MLESLNPDSWAFVMLGLVITAGFYAWAADAILGRFGFGVIITTVIAEGGGYGGLVATDWSVKHRYLPYGYDTPLTYIGVSFIAVTVLLILLCTLKRFFIR
jgi:hypothetical protein